MTIETAWLGLRHQPNSKLTQWYYNYRCWT